MLHAAVYSFLLLDHLPQYVGIFTFINVVKATEEYEKEKIQSRRSIRSM